ncbi:hypothetical protein QBC36DRAFT_165979, partial [Triangularia setosa]
KPRTVPIASPSVGRFRNRPPVTLFIDRESRRETLRHFHWYNVWFKIINHDAKVTMEKCRSGCINPEIETLYLVQLFSTTRIEIPTFFPVRQPLLRVLVSQYVEKKDAMELLYRKSSLRPLIASFGLDVR